MTTKTTISLSPIKRCHGSPHLKKRRLSSLVTHRKQPTMNCEKQISYPDLLQDILIEQQRRETIVNIANTLRKVGDQMDEQLQVMRFFFFYKYLSIVFIYIDKQHFNNR
jgi:hypothetical protein